jgi:hypothetical protein
MNSEIFMSKDDIQDNDNISGKITYTNIMESIPENHYDKPLKFWNKKYSTEWKWRFLRIKNNKVERYVVEISYTKNGKQFYFNKFGEWVESKVDSVYDQFVEKEYYVYTN